MADAEPDRRGSMAQSGEQRSWGLGPGKVLTPLQVLPSPPPPPPPPAQLRPRRGTLVQKRGLFCSKPVLEVTPPLSRGERVPAPEEK